MAVKKAGFLGMAYEAQLEELMDELSRGKVYSCSLRSDKWQLDGFLDGQSIYIDPRPAIIETLLHELLHRRKPKLSERTVKKMANDLVARMDEAMKTRWWKAYERTKKRGPAVDVED